MPRVARSVSLPLALDRSAGVPLSRQLYRALREAILSGRLRPGEALPASRRLAEELGISRITVLQAYDDLRADGYITGQAGSGTFVAALPRPPHDAPDAAPGRASPAAVRTPDGSERLPRVPLSAWAQRVAAHQPLRDGGLRPQRRLRYDFDPTAPDWASFPQGVWARLLGRHLRGAGTALARYGDPAGYGPLREALAAYLRAARGVPAEPGQVVIVSGTQQALDLLLRLTVDPGAAVLVEEPGYPGVRAAAAAYGARVVPVPVDAQGLVIEQLAAATAELDRPLAVVHVTPAYQYPTGAVLPLPRRLALLDWAAQSGALVVEDDYDTAFASPQRPVEALTSLDRHGRAVYLGSFSSVLLPPLRLACAVLPPTLVEPFVAAKWLADRQTPTLEQQVLATFLTEGYYTRHLERVRALYRARRAALEEAVARELAGVARLAPTTAGAGLHALLWLDPRLDEAAVVAAAAELDVAVYPASPCYTAPEHPPALLLGYAALTAEEIHEGVRRLARALQGLLR
jgi:GntR family transcriptional regulator/MocR family aminotransferase